MDTTTLNPLYAKILTHMLGAGPENPKKIHGYRNRYCATIGSPDHATLVEMAEAGLVEAGYVTNNGTSQFFGATVAGCQAIGLGKAAIKRAME